MNDLRCTFNEHLQTSKEEQPFVIVFSHLNCSQPLPHSIACNKGTSKKNFKRWNCQTFVSWCTGGCWFNLAAQLPSQQHRHQEAPTNFAVCALCCVDTKNGSNYSWLSGWFFNLITAVIRVNEDQLHHYKHHSKNKIKKIMKEMPRNPQFFVGYSKFSKPFFSHQCENFPKTEIMHTTPGFPFLFHMLL